VVEDDVKADEKVDGKDDAKHYAVTCVIHFMFCFVLSFLHRLSYRLAHRLSHRFVYVFRIVFQPYVPPKPATIQIPSDTFIFPFLFLRANKTQNEDKLSKLVFFRGFTICRNSDFTVICND
jgi:hypothetical protein